MLSKHTLLFVLTFSFSILLVPAIAFSQNVTPTPETLAITFKSAIDSSQLEKIYKDAEINLKLPENRAVVDARIGNLYWQIDQARARVLFTKALDEVMAAQRVAEIEQKTTPSNIPTNIARYVRQQVLQTIARRDAAYAFESFIKTRPQSVIDVLSGRMLPDFGQYGIVLSDDGISPEKNLIRQENELEQSLALTVVSSDPKRTIDILRRKSPDNLTNTTYRLLQSLRRQDQSTANQIAVEIVQQILAGDFTQSPGGIYFANQVLTEMSSKSGTTTQNEFQLDAALIHQLAEKEADFLIKNVKNSAGPGYSSIAANKSTLISLLPDRAAELNEINIIPRSATSSFSFRLNQDLLDSIKNGTLENLASEAEKYPPAYRGFFYINVANRIAADGDIDRAKEILAKNFSGQRLADLYSSLYLVRAHQAIEQGEYEQALTFIEQVNSRQQYVALIDLAIAIQTKNPGDIQKARAALARVRQSTPAIPVTREDFIKLDKLASGYALVEPETGFQMLEALIGKSAEIADASIITDDFQQFGISSRNREVLLINNNFRLSTANVQLKNFMNADGARTMKILSQVSRSDLRINFELQALESTVGIQPSFF